ncbi:MAG: hypothetical protein ACOCXT_03495 [Candidatus Dojkabacteria bacterium]
MATNLNRIEYAIRHYGDRANTDFNSLCDSVLAGSPQSDGNSAPASWQFPGFYHKAVRSIRDEGMVDIPPFSNFLQLVLAAVAARYGEQTEDHLLSFMQPSKNTERELKETVVSPFLEIWYPQTFFMDPFAIQNLLVDRFNKLDQILEMVIAGLLTLPLERIDSTVLREDTPFTGALHTAVSGHALRQLYGMTEADLKVVAPEDYRYKEMQVLMGILFPDMVNSPAIDSSHDTGVHTTLLRDRLIDSLGKLLTHYVYKETHPDTEAVQALHARAQVPSPREIRLNMAEGYDSIYVHQILLPRLFPGETMPEAEIKSRFSFFIDLLDFMINADIPPHPVSSVMKYLVFSLLNQLEPQSDADYSSYLMELFQDPAGEKGLHAHIAQCMSDWNELHEKCDETAIKAGIDAAMLHLDTLETMFKGFSIALLPPGAMDYLNSERLKIPFLANISHAIQIVILLNAGENDEVLQRYDITEIMSTINRLLFVLDVEEEVVGTTRIMEYYLQMYRNNILEKISDDARLQASSLPDFAPY